MKAAPSQQASLTDLWNNRVPKKERGKTKVQSIEISSMKGGQLSASATPTDSKVMDVDAQSSLPPESSRACKPCSIQGGWLCSRIREYIQLAPIPKDLQSEKPPQP